MPLQTGQVLNQRYRIVRLLGQGGFGAVYRAWDLNLKRPCALKENLDTSPEARSQFEHEAVILAGLDHPNLARVSDHFFIADQGQYLVMDYVEGEDLQEKLERRGGPLPVSDTLRWIAQICDALDYMHSQHPAIIHRDIKPANIRINPQGKAMLVDFGIAKLFDPQLVTTLGARAITPGYSPPEQYGMGKTDARSDIYSLAATTYSLLTGKVPPDAVDILTGGQAPPPLASKLNDAVTQELSQVVAQGMDVKRESRYGTAGAYRSELLAAYEQESAGGAVFVTQVLEESLVSPLQAEAPPAENDLAQEPEPGLEVAAPVDMAGESSRKDAADMVVDAEAEEPAGLSTIAIPDEEPELEPEPPPGEPDLKTVVVSQPGVESLKPRVHRRWPLVAGIIAVALLIVIAVVIGVWALSDGESSSSVLPSSGDEREAGGVPLEMQADLTLWQPHARGSVEQEALQRISELVSERFPGINLEISNFSPEEIGGMYPEQVESGGGPDIVLWGSQDMFPWVEAGLVIPMNKHTDLSLEEFHPVALEAMSMDDNVYGLPLNAWILGLYYNQEMLDEPPMHIEAIRELVANGVSLSAPIDAYYLYGTFGMVGATVLDDAGRCVADRTGGERALIELLELQELGAILENESEFVEGLFLDRAVGMNINGPWVLQMYREVLGDQLRLAPLPESDAGRFIPLLSVDGYMVNPNSEHLDQAIEVVKFLTGREAAQIYSEVAWKVPVRWDVEPPDPLLRNFTELMEFDDLSMRRPEFGNYWDPFGGMFFDVLKNRVDPGLALQEACARMNELNGK